MNIISKSIVVLGISLLTVGIFYAVLGMLSYSKSIVKHRLVQEDSYSEAAYRRV